MTPPPVFGKGLGKKQPGIILLGNVGEICLDNPGARSVSADSTKVSRSITESIPSLQDRKTGILFPPFRRGPCVFNMNMYKHIHS